MKACNSSARTPAATTATNTKALAALFGEALQSTPPAAASTHISGVRPRSGTARIARWAGVGERIRVSHATTHTTNRTLRTKPRPLSPAGWWLAVKTVQLTSARPISRIVSAVRPVRLVNTAREGNGVRRTRKRGGRADADGEPPSTPSGRPLRTPPSRAPPTVHALPVIACWTLKSAIDAAPLWVIQKINANREPIRRTQKNADAQPERASTSVQAAPHDHGLSAGEADRAADDRQDRDEDKIVAGGRDTAQVVGDGNPNDQQRANPGRGRFSVGGLAC
jgi:hypothetical protein